MSYDEMSYDDPKKNLYSYKNIFLNENIFFIFQKKTKQLVILVITSYSIYGKDILTEYYYFIYIYHHIYTYI